MDEIAEFTTQLQEINDARAEAERRDERDAVRAEQRKVLGLGEPPTFKHRS